MRVPKIIDYHKSSIRSRPCVILDPNFPKLVLEVYQNIWILKQESIFGVIDSPIRALKHQKKILRTIKPGGNISPHCPTSNRVDLY